MATEKLINGTKLAAEVFSHHYSVPILENENKALGEVLQMIHNAPVYVEIDPDIIINGERPLPLLVSGVVPKPNGKWEERYRDGFGNLICACSNCGYRAERTNYCPKCGALMENSLMGEGE